MVEVADGRSIFVYSVTDRNETTLKIAKRMKGKDKANKINSHDVIPFYKKYGFAIDEKFKREHKRYISPGTVTMVVTKKMLKASLRAVLNNYLEFFSPLSTYISPSEEEISKIKVFY